MREDNEAATLHKQNTHPVKEEDEEPMDELGSVLPDRKEEPKPGQACWQSEQAKSVAPGKELD